MSDTQLDQILKNLVNWYDGTMGLSLSPEGAKQALLAWREAYAIEARLEEDSFYENILTYRVKCAFSTEDYAAYVIHRDELISQLSSAESKASQ